METMIHRIFAVMIKTICIFVLFSARGHFYKRESILSQAGKTLFVVFI